MFGAGGIPRAKGSSVPGRPPRAALRPRREGTARPRARPRCPHCAGAARAGPPQTWHSGAWGSGRAAAGNGPNRPRRLRGQRGDSAGGGGAGTGLRPPSAAPSPGAAPGRQRRSPAPGRHRYRLPRGGRWLRARGRTCCELTVAESSYAMGIEKLHACKDVVKLGSERGKN